MSERLAIILPDLRGGGAERVGLVLAEAFVALGYAVDVVVMARRGELLAALPVGARLVDLRAPRARQVMRPLVSYIRRERPAALFANLWPLTALVGIANRIAGRPSRMAGVDHSILSRSLAGFGALHRLALRLSIRLFYPGFDARIAVSSGVADDVAALGWIPRGSMTVIHNPIAPPPEGAQPSPADDGLWGAPPGRRILTVGALKPSKNHKLLIRAFAAMRPGTDGRLVILGEGALRPELEEAARREGVADRVLLPGFVGDPNPYYRSADLFVLSSDHEGFGNVLVEALAHGLPVVSTDCLSGPSEVLDGGRYGRLVAPGDPAALAVAMSDALADRGDGEMRRRRAGDFRPEAIARAYLAAVLGGR